MPYILTKIVLECTEIVVSNIYDKMAFRWFFWIAIIFFFIIPPSVKVIDVSIYTLVELM